jgi:tRNA G10  N-methylase Trm11
VANLRRLGEPILARWDARQLPLADRSVHRIVANPPFGKQLGDPATLGSFYANLLAEADRVLKPGGRAVLLASEAKPLSDAARARGWRKTKQLRLRILGQLAFLSVWAKA